MIVELIGTAAATAVTVLGGPPMVKFVIAKVFHGREHRIDADVEIAKQKEITARHKLDLDVKLEGTTQQQVEELHAWLREQLGKLQAVNNDQAETIGRQQAEINHLREALAEVQKQRDEVRRERAALAVERDDLERQVREVIAQGRDLVDRLKAKEMEVSRLTLEIGKRDTRIAELTVRLDDEISAHATTTDALERVRSRGGTERAG